MKWIIVTLVFTLVGCTSTSPSYTQYLLRHDSNMASVTNNAEVVASIGRLEVATYIDSLGLVLETTDGKINVARYHQWAEPLRESLRQYLAAAIAQEAKVPVRFQKVTGSKESKRIDIYIDQLHGDATGHAKLSAYWIVTDVNRNAVVVEEQYSGREPLLSDGYSALVTAQKTLLQNLSKAISGSL